MKQLLTNLTLSVCVAIGATNIAEAQSLSDWGKLLGGGKKEQTTTSEDKSKTEKETTTTQGGSTSGLGDLFNALSGGSTKNGTSTTSEDKSKTEKETTTTQGGSTSGLGDLFNALSGGSQTSGKSSGNDAMSVIGDILGNVIASNTELTVEKLEGTWVYEAPACKFKSEDFLKSAGGDIAASQISKELAPTYTKLGFSAEKFSFKFENDGEYIMTYGKLPLPGEATKAENSGYFTLEFVKLGTVAIASTPAYFEVVGSKMVILFEADKFIDMFRSVVNALGVTTLNTIFDLVDSYDGVLIGFELSKQ